MAAIPSLIRLDDQQRYAVSNTPAHDKWIRYEADTLIENTACSNGSFNLSSGDTDVADYLDGTLLVGLANVPGYPFMRVDISVPANQSAGMAPYGLNPWPVSEATLLGYFTGHNMVSGPVVSAVGGVYTGGVTPYYPVWNGWPVGIVPGSYVTGGTAGTYSVSGNDVTYSLTFYTLDVTLGGTLYSKGPRTAQMRINGTTHNFSLTESTPQTTTFTMREANGTGDGLPYIGTDAISAQWDLIKVTGSVTVTGQTTGPVEMRFRNLEYSHDYPWNLSHFVPIANVVITTADGEVTLDASASYSIDSPIDTYRLKAYNGATDYIDVTQAGATTGPTDISGDLDDDTAVTGSVTVTDEHGCTATDTDGPVTVEANLRADSADLPSKAVYVLHKDGADLKLAFYPEGQSSRTVVSAFTGCKSPSLYAKADSSLVAGMDDGTNFVLKRSLDRGATWSSMATIFSSATYHKAAVTNLLNGGAAAVAVKRGTSPVEVYSLVTANDADWSGSTPVLVGTTASTSTQFSILQKKASNSIEIIISNGVDSCFRSVDSGASWTSF